MSFFCRLSRKHYWSLPHRDEEKHLVQVCYECGAERPARELHSEKIDLVMQNPTAASTAPSRLGILRKLADVK